jgi:adenine phosphoribosyltransferase
MINYKSYIESIPDFPKEGILYRDIQPLLANDKVFKQAISDMAQLVKLPDYWVGIESRGFLFASALSLSFGGGIKLIRKQGKLPNSKLICQAYGLEYGRDVLEMAVEGSSLKTAVLVDDVLATGGTLQAATLLSEQAGFKIIDKLCLLDIGLVKSHNIKCLITYD